MSGLYIPTVFVFKLLIQYTKSNIKVVTESYTLLSFVESGM